jgi:chemotaxis protein MotB
MQQEGLAQDQVSQVRGFADQSLRKKDNPLDPSNRRITLIVQYIVKDADEDVQKTVPSSEHEKPSAGKPAENKSIEQ